MFNINFSNSTHINRLRRFFLSTGQLSSSSHVVQSASRVRPRIEEIREKRVAIFEKELKRQQSLVTRLEKIEVQYQGLNDENTPLIMNKGVSTPYNCAQRKFILKYFP